MALSRSAVTLSIARGTETGMIKVETKLRWLEALSDGAIVVDQSGIVSAANQLAIDILQTNPAGLAAASVIRAPAFAPALKQVQESAQPTTVDIDFRGRPQRHVNAFLSPLRDEDRTLVVLRDLTREQAVEKMRSDFVANASHEMRTPLAAIIGSIETLQGAAKDDPKAREMFLVEMLAQAHRMKRLIDDLLTLSRIELNEHVRPSSKVSLAAIARQAKANLARQADESKVTLEVASELPVEVSGDEDELLQVALNLIENAVKYGGGGGRVEITCTAKGREGILSVRDLGRGIAEDHIPRLTERFYRVSTKESRARGGTGLGLAIVKHIVLRHRGQLDIKSAPNQGSTFTVSIPLYDS
jgi:two-component system, OmpR family, phosphate regulon sensor histidine kinase PhoR